jgi:hypothetical protein
VTRGPDDDDPDPEQPFGPVEPAEFDPADRFGSPEHDLSPRVPDPSADETEVDPDLAATWWGSVVLANVALGGVAVGAMLVYFRGDLRTGGLAVLVGLLAAVGLVRTVRRFHRRHGLGEDDDNA